MATLAGDHKFHDPTIPHKNSYFHIHPKTSQNYNFSYTPL